jgi:hypothetical protein
MAKPKMTKKRFVRAALAAGGIGLLTALAAAVAIKGNHVLLASPKNTIWSWKRSTPRNLP